MYEEVRVLAHSSVMIEGCRRLYVDPFQLKAETHDADLILVTHEHFDHYSPEDIAKVKQASTILVMPAAMDGQERKTGFDQAHRVLIAPGERVVLDGITIVAVAAYNLDKAFHMEENGWVGYVVTMDGIRYYIAGDTDDTPVCRQVQCDVAIVPVGGTYTMTAQEAATLINAIRPKLAIPSHYGSIVGTEEDADAFIAAVDTGIATRR